MPPYREKWVSDCGTVTLYLGDCLDILPTLEAGSVDAVITDPPYSSGGQFRGDRAMNVHAKYVQTQSSSHDRLLGFSGDSRDQFGYWYTIAMWVAGARNCATDGAIVGLFTDWRQLIATCGALQTGGAVFRGIVPWYKRNARPTQGRWANACEYVVWGTYGPRELAGNAFPGFYDVPFVRGEDRVHITQKPVELLESLFCVVGDGTVLDFCMGSGTSGVAAARRGTGFIGIELDAEHYNNAKKRISDELNRHPLLEKPRRLVPQELFGAENP